MTIEDWMKLIYPSEMNPNQCEHEIRLPFADWLEEYGQPIRANGQRWQWCNHKRPMGIKDATWFMDERFASVGTDTESDIPVILLGHMTGKISSSAKFLDHPIWVEFADREQAELELALALKTENIIVIAQMEIPHENTET